MIGCDLFLVTCRNKASHVVVACLGGEIFSLCRVTTLARHQMK